MRRVSTFFLFAALVIFLATFFLTARTPTPYDYSVCRPVAPCDPVALTPDRSHRQAVFFLGMGAAAVVLTGGIVIRSVEQSSVDVRPPPSA
jgi:hypothetical protein